MSEEATSTQETKPTPQELYKALNGVSFSLPCGLLNIHAEATDPTRATTKGVLLKYECDTLHVVSTNGRILLHTSLDDRETGLGGVIPFELVLKVGAKAKRGGERDFFEFVLRPNGSALYAVCDESCVAYRALDVVYPNYRECIPLRASLHEPEKWAAFDMKYLKIVRKYIDEPWFNAPFASGEYGPFVWVEEVTAGEVREAVLMPLRIEGGAK